MIRLILAAAMLCALFALPAEARPKHRVKAPAGCQITGLFGIGCLDAKETKTENHRVLSTRGGAGRILAHPTGCPRRAFCGCGASIRVFGRSIRSLWLARNWFKFPRTSPATKMVAVRNHHVFVLEQHIEGKIWLVYDANSGGGRTRLHPRSIAGYAIVNPHGAMASRGQAL